MSAAPKYQPHYTVADYQQWQGDWELWNGVAIAMTPSPFGRHQWVAGNILSQLNGQLGPACGDCFVLGATDWIVSDDTVVRPDIVVVCGDFPERFIERAPAVVVEVLSDSTQEKDRTAKYQLYEQQQVRFYLLADPATQTIEAHCLSSSGHYQQLPHTTAIDLPLHENCHLQIKVVDCFR